MTEIDQHPRGRYGHDPVRNHRMFATQAGRVPHTQRPGAAPKLPQGAASASGGPEATPPSTRSPPLSSSCSHPGTCGIPVQRSYPPSTIKMAPITRTSHWGSTNVMSPAEASPAVVSARPVRIQVANVRRRPCEFARRPIRCGVRPVPGFLGPVASWGCLLHPSRLRDLDLS